MPNEDRAPVSLPKSFKDGLGKHPTSKIIETFEKVESQKDEINKLKEENMQLKQNSNSVAKPPAEKSSEPFDSEAIKKTCPYPMFDPKLGRHICSKEKSRDLITLPKDRILTDEVCGLCQAEAKKKVQGVPETHTVIEVEPTLEEVTKPEKESTHLTPDTSHCRYATFIPEENKIYCDNQWKKNLPRNRLVPDAVCKHCAQEIKEYIRRRESTKPKEEQKKTEADHEELEDETETATMQEKSQKLYDPRDHLGVCENPFLRRKIDSMGREEFIQGLSCALCKKFCLEKRQACDEIVRKLNTSPMAMRQFMDSSIAKRKKLFSSIEFQTSDSTTLEEIEHESGRDKDPNQEIYKNMYKRYEELCSQCDELRRNDCFEWCEKFKEGVPISLVGSSIVKMENQAMLQAADHQKIEVLA